MLRGFALFGLLTAGCVSRDFAECYTRGDCAASALCLEGRCVECSEDLASPVPEIGCASADTPESNAMVRIEDESRSKSCAGFLIAPDIVLTTRICALDESIPEIASSVFEQWVPFPGVRADPTTSKLSVFFGPDPAAPKLVARPVAFQRSGALTLLGLAAPVDRSVAAPRRLLSDREPVGATWLYVVLPDRRRYYVAARRGDVVDDLTELHVDGVEIGEGSVWIGRESGGPALGVMVSATGAVTFDTERYAGWLWFGPVGWSFCSYERGVLSRNDGAKHKRLQTWWSAVRGDTWTTNLMSGCVQGWDHTQPDYTFRRFEGWIRQTPADGTRPLVLAARAPADVQPQSWWDNLTTTSTTPPANWPSVAYSTLGHVYVDEAHAPARSRPLYLLYNSADTGEWATTTAPKDSAYAGYDEVRVLGYVVDPDVDL